MLLFMQGCAWRGMEPPTLAPKPPRVLLREDFDGDLDEGLAAVLLDDHRITLTEGFGHGESSAIRVAYVGNERGSERVGCTYPLEHTTDFARLSFDVCFEEDFDWTRGGKLHGLAPKHPVTGGRKRRPRGWSARMLFKPGGRCATYLYDQHKTAKWGIGRTTPRPVFVAGQWHHVEFDVDLNDPGDANGSALIRIDEEEVMKTLGVAFRKYGGPDTQIQNFLFSTFHGGGDARWTPLRGGEPTTVYAYFDNFIVTDGS